MTSKHEPGPQDSGAIASTLDALAAEEIPVVSVDTRPDMGEVYMVVRADNRGYGTKACQYLGESWAARSRSPSSRAPWTPSTAATAPRLSPHA